MLLVPVVCTENSVLFDCVTESPNVSGDDRSALVNRSGFAGGSNS
jgi:hypothetical protein